MDIILVIFVLLIIIILIYLVNHKTERFIPDFSNLVKDSHSEVSSNYKVLTNIDNICQYGLTDTHIIQGRNHYLLKNGKPVKNIHIKDKIVLPENWTGIDLLAKHTDNKLFVIKDTHVYFVDDFNTSYELSDLYPNIKSNKYKGIIQIEDKTLFFYNDKVITYNNENKTYKINNIYNNIPKDYDRIFEFYLESYKGEAYPMLYFLKNNHYFRYNLTSGELVNKVGIKFQGFFPLKSELIEFTPLGSRGLFGPRSNDALKTPDNVRIDDGRQTKIISETEEGDYRLEVLGAGQKNGGFGARVFTDLTLKKGDKLDILVGQSGMRLPCQETHDESIKNNLNKLASASGSGASTVKLNGKPLIIAGGGGGFSSGFLKPIKNANATIGNIPYSSIVSIPIKKIIFQIPPNMFTFQGDNSYIKNYETEYIFKDPLIFYTITYVQSQNRPVTLIDLNDNKISIDKDVNKLTPEVVLKQALGYTPLSLRNSQEPINNLYCKGGANLLTTEKVNKNGSLEKIKGNVIVYGGFNGGGVSSMNIKQAIPHGGGGGGAKGGNSALNDFVTDISGKNHKIVFSENRDIIVDDKYKFHTPVSIASGGSSFIESSFNNKHFSGNFNSSQGKVLFLKHSDYHSISDTTEHNRKINHQMITDNYVLSHYQGSLDKNRIINKINIDSNQNLNQLRVKFLFKLKDITTQNINMATVNNYIQIQPVFFIVNNGQVLRYDITDDNALLDTITPRNILHNVPFNEELQKDTNKLSKILTNNLYQEKLKSYGKVNLNDSTLDYENFYEIKNEIHAPSELYFIIETPKTGIDYDLVTIQVNNEVMNNYDYLFNKILKKRH